MLEHDITNKRKERHADTQEDFTPQEVLNVMLKDVDTSLYNNFNISFCDPSAGNGNIYMAVLKNRMPYCNNADDVYAAISSMYGTELMQDNVDECKNKIITYVVKYADEHNYTIDISKIKNILNDNIICTDAFEWDYEAWTHKTNTDVQYSFNFN